MIVNPIFPGLAKGGYIENMIINPDPDPPPKHMALGCCQIGPIYRKYLCFFSVWICVFFSCGKGMGMVTGQSQRFCVLVSKSGCKSAPSYPNCERLESNFVRNLCMHKCSLPCHFHDVSSGSPRPHRTGENGFLSTTALLIFWICC